MYQLFTILTRITFPSSYNKDSKQKNWTVRKQKNGDSWRLNQRKQRNSEPSNRNNYRITRNLVEYYLRRRNSEENCYDPGLTFRFYRTIQIFAELIDLLVLEETERARKRGREKSHSFMSNSLMAFLYLAVLSQLTPRKQECSNK